MQQATTATQTVQRVLQSTSRLPSNIHAAAVAAAQLLQDKTQSKVLPVLDALVRQLPSYDDRMRKHGQVLAALESARRLAVTRENDRQRSAGVLYHLSRAVSGYPSGIPAEGLPNRFFGLPETPVAPTPPRGVYLHGDVGCGKSLLMDMLFASAERHVLSSARVHYHAFMISVYEMIHQYDRLSDEERIRMSLHHPLDAVVGQLGRANAASSGGGLLCFDEFQVADVADARLMHGIFDRLMRSGTVVCFTANRAPGDVNRSQLRDKDFTPFLDLMHERCELIELASGVDYRVQLSDSEAERTKAYFAPDDTRGLHDAWQALTNTDWDDVEARKLVVAYGRELHLARAGTRKGSRSEMRGVQMTTGELIEAAVGASDYRALAKATDAIFVSDVMPVFTSDTRNYARRFITLIDVCYEEKVRIVMRMEARQLDEMFNRVDVSAFGAEIAEGLQFESEVAKEGVGADNRAMSSSSLYTGEDEAFAFRRAVSRLKEMQTKSFGKRVIFR